MKSDEFTSVSVQPPDARNAAVVLVSAGAAAAPSKKFAVPKPTRSAIRARWASEHAVDPPLHASAVALLTSATFPAVPDMLMVPVASGVGSGGGEPVPPAASWTR